MKGSSARATPGRLGRLILRRLFDRPHARRRLHVSLRDQPQIRLASEDWADSPSLRLAARVDPPSGLS